ncbi:MAG: bifunctional diaminohydroxyphosphoribosylaminopyrimidine deaminase/5-amino-6-(5-phosphoribosylamino)uracil reductase RibD [Mariprofundaceae bacterium]
MDEKFMRRALKLAEKGVGTTHPNPRVGAVVVQDGTIVGEGWHQRAGEAHAEIIALQKAGGKARGSTLYVTMEPCNAHGRTPPCVDAVLRAGVHRVVYASDDPNPKMLGGGKTLQMRDIHVSGGVLAAKADQLNRPFLHYIEHQRPLVLAKAAISLDGKMATFGGKSQWISGEQSRCHVHGLRAECDAILIGSGTLRADNPKLTVRDKKCKGDVPLRVIVSMQLPTFRPDYHILNSDAPSRIYVRGRTDTLGAWQNAGVEVVKVTSLIQMLQHLAAEGRISLLLEGGGTLHASFLEARLTDELILYQAPILLGGRAAPGLWHGTGMEQVVNAPYLTDITRKKMGDDQMIRGKVIYPN